MNTLTNLITQTMPSIEIAELTGKRHTHVMRDIRKMLEELEIGETKFGSTYQNQQGKSLPAFNLPKRECLILVSGYNLKMRAAIIDRWQELEQQPQIPQTYSDAMRLAADLADENAVLVPKARAFDVIASAGGSMCISDAAKKMDMNPKALFKLLSFSGWIFKRKKGGKWIAGQQQIDAGLLTVKTTEVDGILRSQTLVTPKGLTHLSKKLAVIKKNKEGSS